MVERFEFHFNESYLIARTEIKLVWKRRKCLLSGHRYVPWNTMAENALETPVWWRYELAGSTVATALIFLFAEFMVSHFGFSFQVCLGFLFLLLWVYNGRSFPYSCQIWLFLIQLTIRNQHLSFIKTNFWER